MIRTLIVSTKVPSAGSYLLFVVILLNAPDVHVSGGELEYNRDIRPILAENCFACHGFDQSKREAGLRLDTYEGAIATLDSGTKAIVPKKPDESELIRRIFLEKENDASMPPSHSGKQLTDSQKEKLRHWVEQGATYQVHWAFKMPEKRPPSWTPELLKEVDGNPIDGFVGLKLLEAGLKPSPEADPATLIRRVSLDLTGLPPTTVELDEFLKAYRANADAAYRELVDRLLRSSSYGERWGRWWLDQARYADSNGYSIDAPRQIWKYRDWVIHAFNRDLPFDRFTMEQLAGDLLPGASDEQRTATGFHRNTQINQEGGIDREQFRIDSIFDRVATTGTVWLGLTIGCAQCHDHKFDPIEQKEYYRLFAFLNNQEEPEIKIYDPELKAPQLLDEKKELEKELQEIANRGIDDLRAWETNLDNGAKKGFSKEVQKILSTSEEKRTAGQRRILFGIELGKRDEGFTKQFERVKEIDRLLESGVTTMVLKELATPRKTTIFIQGDFTRPSDEVTPGTPGILHPLESTGPLNRLDLARWIVDRRNPLTARVIVNRVWQQYFGRGIVETENDFGLQGTTPTHPELLDWLAVDWVERGWSFKDLHRTIVLSKTYRQSSNDREELQEKDPNNYLLARQRRLRLEAEIVRDVGLSVSGLLSNKVGGPPVFPPIPQGVMNQGQVKREWKVSVGEDRFRRGLYTFIYRATPPPSLNVFDAPDGFSTCTRRIRSNTPLQALTLLNDSAYFEFATALKDVIAKEGIENAFRRCTARFPDREELRILSSLDPLSAARVLLNLDETVTRE